MSSRLVLLTLLVLAACAPPEPQRSWPQQQWPQQQQPWAQPQPQQQQPPQPWAQQAPQQQPWTQPCPQPAAGATARPAGPRGTLTVHSQPPGAMVFWRGVFLGGTPLERADVEAGTQQLLLVLPRYEPIFATATVRPGENAVQSLAFAAPSPAVAPSPQRWGGDPGGGYQASRCSQSECERDCFRDGFHCRTDCGSNNSNCEMTCRQLEKSCHRTCERDCR